ncbi:hypothetical protein L6279_04810 [Candidatus Parcubacteria bacterium]|nr:hypothetical protein [Patescibacteria group bacterium]MCG2693384.1 hypothetical protein [Candidatus Parcubacteria bacterium]
MAYLGNMRGPAESEIVRELSQQGFFRGVCAVEQVDEEIELYEYEEHKGEAVPLRQDEEGFFIYLSGLEGKRKFYPEKAGYIFTGDVIVQKKDGQLTTVHIS